MCGCKSPAVTLGPSLEALRRRYMRIMSHFSLQQTLRARTIRSAGGSGGRRAAARARPVVERYNFSLREAMRACLAGNVAKVLLYDGAAELGAGLHGREGGREGGGGVEDVRI